MMLLVGIALVLVLIYAAVNDISYEKIKDSGDVYLIFYTISVKLIGDIPLSENHFGVELLRC